MSDRTRCLTVALDRDYRDDDVQEIMNAIKMMKGVLDVTMKVVDITDYSAEVRARQWWTDQIMEIFKKDRELK